MSFAAGDVLTAAGLNNATRKCIARARRVTDSSATTSTTEVSVVRLANIPIIGGKLYRVTYTCNGDVATNADSLRAVLRYTTDRSTPSTSSTILPGSGREVEITDAAIFEALCAETDYTPAADEWLSLLLTIRHNQGTSSSVLKGDTSVFMTQIYVDDMGDDPGNTGTNL